MINNFLPMAGLIVSLATVGFAENTFPSSPTKISPKKTTKNEIIKYEPKDSVRFGLKGGIDFSNLQVNVPVEFKTGRGLVASLALEIPVDSYLFFQPEVGYSQHRTSFFNAEDGVETRAEGDLLEVQALGKVRFVNSQNIFKPFVIAGIAGGYILKSRSIGKTVVDTSGTTKDYDISLAFGAGFQIQLVSGIDLGLEARYLLGITDSAETNQLSSKNRTLFVGATLFL
ncbi:MAG: porin family protein [Deltaproteobacteria bacterium]